MNRGAVCYLLIIKVKVSELSVSCWYYCILMLKMVFITADNLTEIRFLNLHDENNFFYTQVICTREEQYLIMKLEYCWLIQKGYSFGNGKVITKQNKNRSLFRITNLSS